MLTKTILALSLFTGTVVVTQYGRASNFKTKEVDSAQTVIKSTAVAKRLPLLASLLLDKTTKVARVTTAKPNYTGVVKTVDDVAEQITVRIDNLAQNVNGSGVIVAKQGNTYYGLTAKHVLCTTVAEPQCQPNGTHQIVTPDGAIHQLDYQTVDAEGAWLDIAIFSFESNNDYAVANIGKAGSSDRWIFVSGFPQQNTGNDGKPARLVTGGRLFTEDAEDFTVKETGSLAQTKAQGRDSLLYTNISYGGMSGGAILNSRGTLIGINTGAENEIYFDEAGNYEEYSLGFSLGESITNVVGYLQASDTVFKQNWLSVSKNSAPELNREEVVTIITQLLTTKKPTDDTDLVGWMNYGNQQWRYRRYDEAVNAFNKAIEIDSNFDKAYYAIGLVNYRQGDYDKATTALEKATQINPNPYFYWRWLGLTYGKLQQHQKAIAANPRNAEAYYNRGIVYQKSNQYQLAVDDYTKAIALNSNHAKAYYNRGNTYQKLEQYDRAVNDYSQTIVLAPKDANAYKNRADAYQKLKQYQQAVTDYNRAILLNPNNTKAYTGLGRAYSKLEQYDRARSSYQKAKQLSLSQNNPVGVKAIDLLLNLLDTQERIRKN